MNNEEIIKHLFLNNGERYNLHKASEEFQELALVLNQFLLKPNKVDVQEIIDEIGDCKIRLAILEKMVDLFPPERVQERINKKLSKYNDYIDHKTYNEM
jgi:hypothetical protein